MLADIQDLQGRKLYFASDFHLGVPDRASSLTRERKIVKWLEEVRHDAHTIFLLGDIFDFWFEYKHAIPKGFARLQGKLAELTDSGVNVVLFTGNHDMWMFDYFPTEFNIPVYREPQVLKVGQQRLLIGHGDGLGPGDRSYKFLKKIFESRICQWLFARLHPNLGIGIAKRWSKHSRISNDHREEDAFKGNDEFLWEYCKQVEKKEHHDLYIFGHRHLPLDLEVGVSSRYINLGEWVNHYTYAVYDREGLELREFEG